VNKGKKKGNNMSSAKDNPPKNTERVSYETKFGEGELEY
jgi:hypothetical protein